MKWQELCALAQELPEVEQTLWYGTPSLKVRGKGFVRLKEDGASVVFMLDSVDEQELLIVEQPDLYYITDHYRGWPTVLARLAKLGKAEARHRLERAFRRKAPKSVLKQLDAARDGAATQLGVRPAPKRAAKPKPKPKPKPKLPATRG